MFEIEAPVSKIIRRGENVKSFRFTTDKKIDFLPGQYLLLTINIGGLAETKPLSISNSPTEFGYIEFTKRITESAFSKKLDSMKEGDKVFIKGPFGRFTFSGEHKKIALLSGGIGITPFRSICKFACDGKIDSDIFLIYGNNSLKDILFRADLDEMAKNNPHFHVIYTLTAEDLQPSGCLRTGYIDKDMISKEMSDYRERIFYVCGPPPMVKKLTDMLRNCLNVSDASIKVEQFMGYV
ncbi:MAG: FAD-dependent oxidoreductase [Candidatus Omnitrophica bacterium]|nr:FAD-dependent oxidoreductase [Candidatus Omnitrophota bacterium]